MRLCFPRNLTADVRILVEPLVIGIRPVRLLADDCGRAEDNPCTDGIDLGDHILQATLELFGRRSLPKAFTAPLRQAPVPDVIDADIDHNDRGFLLKDIAVQALLTVRNFMAADACTNDFNSQFWICLGNGL